MYVDLQVHELLVVLGSVESRLWSFDPARVSNPRVQVFTSTLRLGSSNSPVLKFKVESQTLSHLGVEGLRSCVAGLHCACYSRTALALFVIKLL